MTVRGIALACLGVALSFTGASATTIKDVDIADLFREADVVAVVEITAADRLAFSESVYRANVVLAFKGVGKHTTIYFGPYDSYALGDEYVAFLKRSDSTLGDLLKQRRGPWPKTKDAPYFRVMYAGYSVLRVDYTCIIPTCADAVFVPTSQVHLPASLEVFPDGIDPGSNFDGWVYKGALISVLEKLASASASQ